MPLFVGTKLGPYEILAPLGKGGMGEVYRAKDTKLDREVAIKVLPTAFAQHPERLARFEREAKVLAALNHPNIASIYAVEESPEGKALVMELVPGETLKGPVPLDTALKYAGQIASALDAAHEKGIIHRDLKPGNIMLTPEGLIKVLDFGLAAVTLPSAENEGAATITMSPTRVGTILGTAAYMSPEQASGKTVDQRTDIWAFGVVLWELLTGKRLFTGDTISHVLASVLKDEPDLKVVPTKVQRLLQRCLQKEASQRLRSIHDWQYLLSEEQAAPQAAARTRKLPWVIATAALTVAALGLGFVHFRETPSVEQTLRYSIAAPENSQVHSFALSPDGHTLVIAADVNGKRQLWLRPMDALQAQPIAFTEDATYPFWSPDSRYIGFFAEGKLKKVAASGGPSQSLCDALNGRGGSWGRDDVIIFSPNPGISIQRVAAAGGVATDVPQTKGDQRFPVFLPDGRRFLYLVRGGGAQQTGIYVNSLDGKENRRILPDLSGAVFAPSARTGLPAHLLFARENTLMAVPFDASSAQVSGEVFPVADGVAFTTSTYLPLTVSENGVLLYATSSSTRNQIAWMDRSGKLLGPVGAPGLMGEPALSPEEKLVTFRRGSSAGSDLWVRDLSRGTETRLTSDPSTNTAPFWSPKGDRLVFTSSRKSGIFNLYEKAANGSGQDELLLSDSANLYSTQWSRDGRFIVYTRIDQRTKFDLWVLPVEVAAAERKPVSFLQSEFNELYGQLSPDSHWMAFTSDRSGRQEVYVRPFPAGEGEDTVSIARGDMPRWRGDGKELFLEGADGKLMSVPVKATVGTKVSFEAGAPTALFDAHMRHSPANNLFEYDVTADGKRFLINTVNDPGVVSAPQLTVVTNWQAGMKK